MKYFAILTSGDRIALEEEEFTKLRDRMLISALKNIVLKNGGVIYSRSIVYLGPQEETAKGSVKEPVKKVK